MWWISRYLKANPPAAEDMEDLGGGSKVQSLANVSFLLDLK